MNRNRMFSYLYRNRVKIHKGTTTIANLSFFFMLLLLVIAPWLAVIGLILSLALGYRFSIEKNAPHFSGDPDEVIRDAKRNVQNMMNGSATTTSEPDTHTL